MPFFGYTGEPLIEALVEKGQLLVIQSHQVKNCRMQIGNVMRFFDGLEANLVGGADGLAAFHPTSGQPHAVTVPVVIAAEFANALTGWGPTEFAAPRRSEFHPRARFA